MKRQIYVRPDSLNFDDLTNFIECDDAELVWTQQVWNEILRKRRVQERVGIFAKAKNSARRFTIGGVSETVRAGKKWLTNGSKNCVEMLLQKNK